MEDRTIKITDLNKLLNFAKQDGGFEYYIRLAGGIKSSKQISYDEEDNQIYLQHYIDGTEEVLTLGEFMDTNTIRALDAGTLYYYEN